MFFYLSKILTFLISPTVIILILLLSALVVKSAKRRRRLLISSLVLLLVFSNPFIINQLMRAWELEDTAFIKQKHYDTAIVLAGFMTLDPENTRLTFGDDVDRLTESLALYRQGRIERILISGGSGRIINDTREASLAKSFLVNYCAVPDSVVLIDTISRNSYENAVESKKILHQQSIRSSLLITSAFHMRRAKGCFDKLNIPVDTYSTDPTSSKQDYYPSDLIIPATENLRRWELLMHELAGVIIYKIKGYS